MPMHITIEFLKRSSMTATACRNLLWGALSALCLQAVAAHAQVITEFSEGIIPNAIMYGITRGPDGNIWFTEAQRNGAIRRITSDGVVTEFSVGLDVSYTKTIVTGPDGNLWFTQWDPSTIGKITPAGFITEIAT